MYTTTLDVNKNYDNEILEHGVIHIKNEKNILFTPKDFLKFAKTAIPGVVGALGDKKEEGNYGSEGSPAVVRLAIDGFASNVGIEWHADSTIFKECSMAVCYNKNNCQVVPTRFINNRKVLKEIFNDDFEYLKQIKIVWDLKLKYPGRQMADNGLTDKNKFGWFWDYPVYCNDYLTIQDQNRSPLSFHPVTKKPFLNLSINVIEEIHNDTKGLYSEVIEKLKQYSHEVEDKFVEESSWSDGDFMVWDNCQVIHSRRGWEDLVEFSQDPKRELWRVNMFKPL
jgi:hypothetical protein